VTASEPGVVAVADVVLRARGVHKAFAAAGGRRQVLSGLDLAVAPGEIVAVAGRSGSGKTTLLSVLAGWERADLGTVELGRGAPPPAGASWREVAVLPQTLGLLDELTVGENVTLPLRLGRSHGGGGAGDAAGRPAADDPDRLLARLGLDHLATRYPSEVSLGEQQRAALARAAVIRPAVLLADEPIAHQNVAWAETMMAAVRELADAGTSCLLATHNDVAFTLADRVLELEGGRLRPRPGPDVAVRAAAPSAYPGGSAVEETPPPCSPPSPPR
jgi:putative ABC transport system ATP-binding protein